MHSALANPYENTICETLRKVYFLLAPPHCSGRAQSTPCISSGHPQQLQTLRHHDPQTHLKRRLPLLCLPQRLHFFWAATGRLAPAPWIGGERGVEGGVEEEKEYIYVLASADWPVIPSPAGRRYGARGRRGRRGQRVQADPTRGGRGSQLKACGCGTDSQPIWGERTERTQPRWSRSACVRGRLGVRRWFAARLKTGCRARHAQRGGSAASKGYIMVVIMSWTLFSQSAIMLMLPKGRWSWWKSISDYCG